jgi:hypothetical protein
MMFGVLFRSVVMVVGRMQRMAVGDFRVVRRFLVMARLVMLSRFAMVLRGFVVMVSGFFVMLVDVVLHDPLLGCGCRNIASHHETFATRIWQQKVNRKVGDTLA